MKRLKIFAVSTIIAVLLVCAFSLSGCNKDADDVFQEDKTFTIDNQNTNIMGILTGVYLDAVENLTLDMDNTYFEFKKTGVLHAQIQTKAGLLSDMEAILSFFNISEQEIRNMLESFDLSVTLNKYVEPMFPGFEKKLEEGNLEGALGLIKSSLGFNVTGIDGSDSEITEAVKYIGETKKLPDNLLDIIPKDTVITLTFDTEYSIRNLKGADGTEYCAIYIGYDVKDNPSTQPFGIFTATETNGKTSLFLRIEFMNVDIGLIEK